MWWDISLFPSVKKKSCDLFPNVYSLKKGKENRFKKILYDLFPNVDCNQQVKCKTERLKTDPHVPNQQVNHCNTYKTPCFVPGSSTHRLWVHVPNIWFSYRRGIPPSYHFFVKCRPRPLTPSLNPVDPEFL